MRNFTFRVLFGLGLIVSTTAGCGYIAGGAAWVAIVNSQRSGNEPPNTPPVANLTTPSGSVNDLVSIQYGLIDLQYDPVDLIVEYSTDGGAFFHPATEAEGAGSSGISGLETGPVAVPYVFVWNTLLDLGSANLSNVTVRFTPVEAFRDQVGEPVVTAPFSILNAFVATVAGGVVGAGLNFPNGIAVDASGVIYIADTFNNRIIRYDPAIDSTSVYAGTGDPGFSGDNVHATQAKLNLPFGVAVDANGDLIICDFANHRLRIVDATTGFIDTLAGGGSLSPPNIGDGGLAVNCVLSFPSGIALDASGNVYVADRAHNRVRVVSRQAGDFTVGFVTVSPFTIETVAGIGVYVPGGANGDGGPAVLAQVGSPFGVAVDDQGRIYISEPDENRVRVVNPSMSLISVAGVTVTPGGIATIVGNGISGFAGDGGSPAFAQVRGPNGLTIDGNGNLYVVDTGNFRVRVVNTNGGPLVVGNVTIDPDTIRTITGTGVLGANGDGGPAQEAELLFPTGATIDIDGDVLVSEGGGNRVRLINTAMTSGQWGPVVIDPGDINSLSISLEEQGLNFAFPARIVVDKAGDIFFTDISDLGTGGLRANRIYRLDGESGEVSVIAGTGGSGFTGDGGPAEDATFSFPADLTLDLDGNLYIADTYNHRIRVVNNNDSPLVVGNVVILPDTIETVAGAGFPGYAGDGAPPTFALMRSPISIDLDGDGNLYIAEMENHVLRVVNVQDAPIDIAGTTIDPSTIRTVVGDGTAGFSGDGGAATTARLNTPLGITLDPAGNVFIADSGNFRVRGVNVGTTITTLLGVSVPPGAIRTVVGAGFPGSSGDGGSALSARISEVRDILLDPYGNLWMADSLNHRIRLVNGEKVDIFRGGVIIDPGFIDTVVGSGQAGFNGDGLPNLVTSLNEPTGFGLVDGENVVLADSSNGIVRMVNFIGSELRLGPKLVEPLTVRAIAGDPGGQGNRLVVAPVGLALDPAGDVIFTDTKSGNSHSHRIFRLDPITRSMTVIGGTGNPGLSGDSGPVGNAEFDSPSGVALDASGNLYIADTENHVVRVVNRQSTPVTIAGVADIEPGNIETIAGVGSPGYDGNGMAARNSRLRHPAGVAVAPTGEIIISDTANHQIRVIDTSGKIYRLSGNDPVSSGILPGEFSQPMGIHLHTNGTLYVADSKNNRIQAVNTTTAVASVVVGSRWGIGGFNGDGLPPEDIRLASPLGVAADSAGNLFIVDTGNNRLLVYNPQVTDLIVSGIRVEGGVVRKIAGTNKADFNGDALPPAFTALSSPSAVLIDPAGDIFISDTGNRRVRRFAR